MVRPAVRTFPVAGSLALSLALSSIWGAAGCIKVNEQPPLPEVELEPPPAAPVVKKAPRPNRPWAPTAFASDPAPPPAQVAAKPDAARPVVETLNGDPNGLKREDLQKILDGAMPAFAACFEKSETSVNVGLSFDADPAGGASNLKVTGGDPASSSCVKKVVSGLRLPGFSGPAVPVHFPLSIHASTRPKPAASAPPAVTEPARPAPVFVNP
jgi:hypothetical protein